MIEKSGTTVGSSAERDPREMLDLYSRILALDARLAGANENPDKLPPNLYSFLGQVLGDLTAGKQVAIFKDDAALTTMEAAILLGGSRETLVQLLDRQQIPFHMAGMHRRVHAHDVLAFMGRRDSARLRSEAGLVWGKRQGRQFEQAPGSDSCPGKIVAWSEIKDDVRDYLLASDQKEPRIRLNALDRLEKDFAAIFPEFPENPAVLLDAGKDEVARRLARFRTNGLLHAAESEVLNHIFKRLEIALLGTRAEPSGAARCE
jgi:excisionase family DNA binding protein